MRVKLKMPFRSFYSAPVQAMAKRTARRIAYSRGARQALAAAYRRVGRRRILRSGPEWKTIDKEISVDVNYDGGVNNLYLLNPIARGDDYTERIGRTVTLKSLQIKAQMYVTPTTGVDQVGRMLVVYDKQPNASAVTAAQLFNASADSTRPFQFRNLENRERFVVLADVTKTLSASAESGSKAFFKIYKKLNLPMTFNSGDAGTIADIVTGSIYVVCTGSEASGATDAFCVGESRIRFIDG